MGSKGPPLLTLLNKSCMGIGFRFVINPPEFEADWRPCWMCNTIQLVSARWSALATVVLLASTISGYRDSRRFTSLSTAELQVLMRSAATCASSNCDPGRWWSIATSNLRNSINSYCTRSARLDSARRKMRRLITNLRDAACCMRRGAWGRPHCRLNCSATLLTPEFCWRRLLLGDLGKSIVL